MMKYLITLMLLFGALSHDLPQANSEDFSQFVFAFAKSVGLPAFVPKTYQCYENNRAELKQEALDLYNLLISVRDFGDAVITVIDIYLDKLPAIAKKMSGLCPNVVEELRVKKQEISDFYYQPRFWDKFAENIARNLTKILLQNRDIAEAFQNGELTKSGEKLGDSIKTLLTLG